MFQLAIASLRQPAASIETVLRMPVSNDVLYRVAIVLACLSGVLDPVVAYLANGPDAVNAGNAPVVIAGIQLVAILITAVAVFRIGGMFGGVGDYNGALKVSVWYGIVSILPSIAILLFQVTGSGAASLVQLCVLVWMLFILSSFVKVLHRFDSVFLTFLGVIGASFVIGIVSLLVLISFGLVDPGTM